MSAAEKPCTSCGVPKPLSQFSPAADHDDGHASWCKSCVAANAALWREDNPEKNRESKRKSYEKNIERSRALSRARNARWREKMRLEGLAKGLRKEKKNEFD